MRTFQYEQMRPEELLEVLKTAPIAYLPVGPLEWHGPHNPFGTDALNARAVAEGAVKATGGVVFPTLYCGTEAPRSPEIVKRMGFEDENTYVVGMDVPGISVPSCYYSEEAFGMILRENLRVMMKIGFRLVVIVNGHGADGQIAAGQRIARELSHEGDTKVLFCFGFQPECENDPKMGHANISETSIMMYLHPDSVRLEALPSRDVKLKTSQCGIADSLLFQGKGNAEHTVDYDPRDATAELGRRYVERATQYVIDQVREALD